MKIKVHWIVDGIAELDADSQEEAEKWVNEALTNILMQPHTYGAALQDFQDVRL